MAERELSLTPRAEAVRESRPVITPIHFTLEEIIGHFREGMESVKLQYIVADSLLNQGNETGGKTIWRSQIVFAEGLLDYFIHEMSKYCLFQMFTGQWEKSMKYDNLMIPMSKVESAINANNSSEWFFSYLNDRFSRDVFLAAETMRDQLNLIGINHAGVMTAVFPMEKEQDSIKEGLRIIQEMFQRRNAIVHQNDRSHATAEQNDISKEYVEDYINTVEYIANAIWDIAVAKNQED